MRQYLGLIEDVLENGERRGDRTGVGTVSLFGGQCRYDLSEGFPMVTTKYVPFRLVKEELRWFLSGSTNVRELQEKGIHIWDEWANEFGELGPVYGRQWRWWRGRSWMCDRIDQIREALWSIIHEPESRRIVVSAWNVTDLSKMALPPCHCFFQFYVSDGNLSCHLYQRSADVFLGVPFNIASYALLTHVMARLAGLGVGEFIHSFGDVHLYQNHLEQAREQLSREPYALPRLVMTDGESSFDRESFAKHDSSADMVSDFLPDRCWDAELEGYEHHPHIKAEVAV